MTWPALLDAEGAAALLGVSRRHLQQLDRSGRLGPQSIRLGRSVRWSRDELERWAACGCPVRIEWAAAEGQRLPKPAQDAPKGRGKQGFVNGAGKLSAGLSAGEGAQR